MSMLPKPAPTNIWQRYINVGYTESFVHDDRKTHDNDVRQVFCQIKATDPTSRMRYFVLLFT
jgi:hypothetical protein